MSTATISLSYQQPTSTSTHDIWCRLEQQPVSSGKLTENDLNRMLALVLAGKSARAYRPESCEGWVSGDTINADLAVYVWPSALDLPYTLEASGVTMGVQEAWQQERDFDAVLEMSATLQLPFLVDQCQLSWQTPAYNRFGEVIAYPELTVDGAIVTASAECFGVLRVRCLALGWRHAAAFSTVKVPNQKITEVHPSVRCTWIGADGKPDDDVIDLDLPSCLDGLLESCGDGTTMRDRVIGHIGDEEDQQVANIYYSTCTGQVLALRYEHP